MSNEIVQVVDGISEAVYIPSFQDLFKNRPEFGGNLIGPSHEMRHFLKPEKGQRYVTQSNPTPASAKTLLDSIKEPFMLQLRGCDKLFLTTNDFSFEKFKTLSSLEISSVSHLTTLPEAAFSEMTQLHTLILSQLPKIQKLPERLFSDLTHLRSLVLKGCSGLDPLPNLRNLYELQLLDLSYLRIETLPSDFFPKSQELRWVLLRGCCKLRNLPVIPSQKLEVLDLSHCTGLENPSEMKFTYPRIRMLDLSCIAFTRMPSLYRADSLTHLMLKDTKVTDKRRLTLPSNLKVLDLSGARYARQINLGFAALNLVALDLSRSDVESVDYLSDAVQLRSLILRDCSLLVELPEMNKLIDLEVLDISGCELLSDLPKDLSKLTKLKEFNLSRCSGLKELIEGLFDRMSCLEKLNLSKLKVRNLPSFMAKLQPFTKVTLLDDDDDDTRNVSREEVVDDGGEIHARKASECDEIHLVSTFLSTSSGFDQFSYNFGVIKDDIMKIQNKFMSASETQLYKRNFGGIRDDLQYILDKIGLLESSVKRKNGEQLLKKLVDVATHLSRVESSHDDYTELNELLRIVALLKLLVHPGQVDDKEEEKYEANAPSRSSSMEYNEHPWRVLKEEEIQKSYDSLDEIQRNCLLCFAVFPRKKVWDNRDQILKSVNIKKRSLIHWWIGEGFLDEEVGEEVFKVLVEKKFVMPVVVVNNWESRSSCCMRASVHAFVIRKALEERFFDFHGEGENPKLTPHLNGSERACLLRLRQENQLPSSCKLWENYAKSRVKSECFNTIRTLLNVDETIIDIKVEWFSKMRKLLVLHLENLNFGDEEQIEVVDLKFLEELKNMKKLRLLSLKGFPTMIELPDSVCKLKNLKILILRDCGYLEELPSGIGSLKQLIHLDLTYCHTLSKLPKGVRLLSKLEVLKGFVVSYQIGGRQHKQACTLRELLELDNLTKLNVIVNADKFPCSEDVQVLKEMTNLRNLKITWGKNYSKEQEQEHEVSSRRCWEKRPHQHGEVESSSRGNHFDNLTKMVLCCYPAERAPIWLHPSEMHKLEKLYIVGGKVLKMLPGDADQNTWNSVNTLRLRHLPSLDMDWSSLKAIFSNMMSFEVSKSSDDHRYMHQSSDDGKWHETSENLVWEKHHYRR